MVVRRLGSSGRTLLSRAPLRESLALPNLCRKASDSWSAVRETYFSTKQVFESHRVVFTVGTSIASVLTAWAGYSIRQIHQSKIDSRLQSIEQCLKDNHKVEHEEIKKIVTSSNISTPACVATAWTTLVLGYVLGWRGGAWYTRRNFRREQLKLMGQIKSHSRWQILRRPFIKLRNSRFAAKIAKDRQSANKTTEAPFKATNGVPPTASNNPCTVNSA